MNGFKVVTAGSAYEGFKIHYNSTLNILK